MLQGAMAAHTDWILQCSRSAKLSGGQVQLPSRVLGDVQSFLQGDPLVFELGPFGKDVGTRDVNAAPGFDGVVKPLAVGVSEFNAADGKVQIPFWMADELGMKEGEMMKLKLVRPVKKATILTLQPYESAFGEMLEKAGGLAPLTNALRGFTAVRKGTNITVPFEGKEYKLDVVETQPDEIVTIVGFGREVKLDLLLAKDYLDPEIERQESNSNEAEEKKKKDAAEILGTELEDIWSSDDEEAADEAKAAISRIRGADGRINTDMQFALLTDHKPEERIKADARLKQRLAPMGLKWRLDKVHIRAQGDCMFDSLADQLHLGFAKQEWLDRRDELSFGVRSRVVEWLRRNGDTRVPQTNCRSRRHGSCPLNLVYNPYDNNEFQCEVCKKVVREQEGFHCSAHEWDICLDCIRPELKTDGTVP